MSNYSRRACATAEERREASLQRVNKQPPNISPNTITSYLSEENVKNFNNVMLSKSFEEMKKNGRPTAIENRDTFINECRDYFIMCNDNNVIPTIAALCVFLGIAKDTLFKYANDPQGCEFSDVATQVVSICHAYTEMGAIAGKIPTTIFQFLGTNYFGLKNTQQVEVKPTLVDPTINNQETLKIIKEQIASENGTEE